MEHNTVFRKMVSDQGLVTVNGIRQGVLQNKPILLLLPSPRDQEESADIQQENCLWNSRERKSVSGILKSSN